MQLEPGVQLLSLDVFGTALEPMVLHDDDVHRLVAGSLRLARPDVADDYVDLRRRAERRARSDAADRGRSVIGVVDIADRLPMMLDMREPLADRDDLARAAIRLELRYNQLLWRPSPIGVALYREARRAGIPVAFVADSALPHDLILRILTGVGYHHDHLVVSSQEGSTKASGALLQLLAKRAHIQPESILHVGPDPHCDGMVAGEAGMRTRVQDSSVSADPGTLGPFLDKRSGVDAILLTLAARRIEAAGASPNSFDVGYYAGGPLAVGFAVWLGDQIRKRSIDQVLLCGQTGGLLKRLLVRLWPDLDAQLVHVPDAVEGGDGPGEPLADAVETLGAARRRVLVVDIGRSGRPHLDLDEALAARGRVGDSIRAAYLGVAAGDRDDDERVDAWSFGPGNGSELATRLSTNAAVLEATLQPPLAAGIERFAGDAVDWVRLDRTGVTPTLAAPALRVAERPTYDEAVLLGSSPTLGHGVGPLTLPEHDDGDADFASEAAAVAAVRSAWPSGGRALTDGPPRPTRRRSKLRSRPRG